MPRCTHLDVHSRLLTFSVFLPCFITFTPISHVAAASASLLGKKKCSRGRAHSDPMAFFPLSPQLATPCPRSHIYRAPWAPGAKVVPLARRRKAPRSVDVARLFGAFATSCSCIWTFVNGRRLLELGYPSRWACRNWGYCTTSVSFCFLCPWPGRQVLAWFGLAPTAVAAMRCWLQLGN
jgi:hypothetical protein